MGPERGVQDDHALGVARRTRSSRSATRSALGSITTPPNPASRSDRIARAAASTCRSGSADDRQVMPLPRATARPADRREHEFAKRYELPTRSFETQLPGVASQGTKVFIEKAVEAAQLADDAIASLQDSMLPVEFGDAELRSGLAEVRVILDPLPRRARDFVRTLGR